MALRIAFTSPDAGNNLGTHTADVRDWHRDVADFHLGTGHTLPTQMPDIRLQANFIRQQRSVASPLTEESIYGC